MDDVTIEEATTTRRVVAKGVAAGGLAALFAAVGAGRMVASAADGGADDTNGDGEEFADETADGADTSPDDGAIGEDSLDSIDSLDGIDGATTDDAGRVGAPTNTGKGHEKRGKGQAKHANHRGGRRQD
jgi:hypothetical protein